jgi:microcystin-dependent protein
MALTQIRQTVIDEPYSGVVPIGGIIMFKGNIASLPSGWSFCNGSNGTPDLRDKFIIGAAADSGGQANTTVTGSTTKNGGSKDAVLVSHSHTATVTDPGHFHRWGGGGNMQAGNDNGGQSVNGGSTNIATSTIATGITVANDTQGVSGTDQNLPPYYALAFIMRIS